MRLFDRTVEFEFLQLHYLFQKLRTCHANLRNDMSVVLYLVCTLESCWELIKNPRPHPRPTKSETPGEGSRWQEFKAPR